jgi:hypothetical protein
MPRTTRPRIILSLACCCLCLYPGCLALPIPQRHRNIETMGQKVEEAQLSFVVPGQTTKAEFIEKVGQPYLMMDDWGVMAYDWKMLAAYVPYLGYYIVPGISKVEFEYLLLVSYDDQGVIKKYETNRIESSVASVFSKSGGTPLFGQKTVNEQALQWVGQGADLGRKFTPVDLPAGKSVVYVFHRFDINEVQQSPDRLDGVFLDGNLWAELKWHQYAPIVVSSGSHTIGFEPNIRKTDKFLHPHRPKTEPALTTTIDALPNQSYFLEISFIERDSRDFKKTPVFSRFSEGVALPKLVQLKRAR